MLPTGYVLNDTYRVERLLGHGGMAAVYVVSHTRLPRRFALKIIAASLSNQQALLDRFRREAEILASLNHPHVVNVVDWNVYEKQYPYLVMELLEGEDLAHYLHAHGPLTKTQALPIFLQIAEALQAAHAAAIVHRDLKPANIFITNNGPFPNYIRVLDFGIAKVLNSDAPTQTAASALMGTPAYMAPEQAMGHNHLVDARTDQFALAVILYEMLTGCSAFFRPGDSTLATLTRVVQEDPASIDDAVLWPALARAMSKEPSRRYPTLREFVEATGAQELTASLPILQQRTKPLGPRPPVIELRPPLAEPRSQLPEPKLSPFSNQATTLAPIAPVLPQRRNRRQLLAIVGVGLVGSLLLALLGATLLANLRRRGAPGSTPAPAHLPTTVPEFSASAEESSSPPVLAASSAKSTLRTKTEEPGKLEHPEPVGEPTTPASVSKQPSGFVAQAGANSSGERVHRPHASPPLPRIILVERLASGPFGPQPALTLLPVATQEQVRKCTASFFVEEGGALPPQLDLLVLPSAPRFSWVIGRTKYSYETAGPRNFDYCLHQINPPTLSPLIIGVVIQIHATDATKSLP